MSSGWTIVEVVVVACAVALLGSIMAPSLTHARDQARETSCAAAMHAIYQGLMCYAVDGDRRLPPFRFSGMAAVSLLESGHWGGTSQIEDPVLCGSLLGHGQTSLTVNLWQLAELGYVQASSLVCPGAGGGLRSGEASMFQYSNKFSSYCMRFPYSPDLFRESPALAYYYCGGGLLDIYRAASGGQQVWPVRADSHRQGLSPARVPVVRIDRSYRIEPTVAGSVGWGDGVYDAAGDTMLADGFWWQDRKGTGQPMPGVHSYPVLAGWCHGDRFNALSGGGSVRAVQDDPQRRPVKANSIPASGQGPQSTGPCDATAAERVWQFLDLGGRLN